MLAIEMRRPRERQWEQLAAFTFVWLIAIGIWIWARLSPPPPGTAGTMTDVFVIGLRNLVDQSMPMIVVATPVLAGVWVYFVRRERTEMRMNQTITALRSLTPDRFEDWCAARLRDMGHEVNVVGGQGDHGVDLVATRDGQKIAVQCRRFGEATPVTEPQLRDLYGTMHALGASRAIMITTGRYTSAAKEWSRGKPIDLWGPERLGDAPATAPVAPRTLDADLASSLGACPWSRSPLVVRTNRKSGQQFIGCSDYPNCKYTRPI